MFSHGAAQFSSIFGASANVLDVKLLLHTVSEYLRNGLTHTFNRCFTSMYEQYQSPDSNEYDTTTIDHNIESKIPDNIEFSTQG